MKYHDAVRDLAEHACQMCGGRGTLDFVDIGGDPDVPCQACERTGWRGGKAKAIVCVTDVEELQRARQEADSLATNLYKKFYAGESDAVGFELLIGADAVLTQIDNMVTGLVKDDKHRQPDWYLVKNLERPVKPKVFYKESEANFYARNCTHYAEIVPVYEQ